MPAHADATPPDVVCHVRFSPGGEEHSASVQLRPVGMRSGAALTPGPGVFEATIPPETTAVEVWFERREGVDATGSDAGTGKTTDLRSWPAVCPP